MAATSVTGIGPARRRVREGSYSLSRGLSVSSEQPSPDRPPTPVPRDSASRDPVPRDSLLESVRPYLRASGNGAPPPPDAEVERALTRIDRLATLGELSLETANFYSNVMTVIVGYLELLRPYASGPAARTYVD